MTEKHGKHLKEENKSAEKSEVALTEERVLANWQEKKIFEKTLEATKDGKPFVFYDGPPFATGEPHYGHILAGTIKDAIPRYQTMKGRYVRRQWGWDCHGLPLENIIEKELNLSHKKDIEEYGIGNFNEAARRAVLRFDKNWKEVVPRLGRFVDMERAYKTMDATYSESIWWAFKNLYDKGLIYEGHKIMYVCPRCETPLAQIEVAQGYKDVTDISVTVKFELKDDKGVYVLAWTTTPWTLPGNTALAINPDIEYVKIKAGEEYYILTKERCESVMKDTPYTIIAELKGSALIGKSYIPPFDYYVNDKEIENNEHGWKIYGADFVTADSGTGIAHEAPAFGADDMELAKKENIPIVQHVSLDGKFKPEVKDFAGMYVKQKGDTQSADIEIIKYLAHKGLLFSKEKVIHSYPLCWRCDTPLLNYATPSWFVKTTAISEKVLSENKKIGWVPEHVGAGRFGKWLESPRDWAISRSRFWGAPLPVWKCAECEKIEIFGSIDDLSRKASPSGNNYMVIRHGEAENNTLDRSSWKNEDEYHLTEKGKEQVLSVAKTLLDRKIDMIISSPILRTRETSEILAKELNIPVEHVILDERLSEVKTGIFQNRRNNEYHAYFKNTLEKFTKTPPNGENLTDMRHRTLAAIHDMERAYKEKNILIVTHEYTAWMLFTVARGLTNEDSVVTKDERGDDFLKNAEVEKLQFLIIPRNADGELDFHRPYIDEVIFDCECGGIKRRIPDVFDCWFESGSMPYAQFHYMGDDSTKEGKIFRKNFPADFIAEGMDQTRGWFYSLLMLGVGLFGESPYKNVIVNGTILAEDGQKMSKRLKNYPDPMDVVNKYGADALRYYLLSSPTVRGEDLSLTEKGIDEVYKKNIVRLNNVYSFYELYRGDEETSNNSENVLDRWIIARLSQLINETTSAMDAYELDRATKPIGEFIDDLSTWYIRRSRDRFKSDDQEDKTSALSTTKYVLIELSKVLAPFMPFVADDLYLKVTKGSSKESVHLESWPERKEVSNKSKEVVENMQKVREIVSLGLEARAKEGIKVRQPLLKLEVRDWNLEKKYIELVKDEVNVKDVVFVKILKNEVELDTNITPELKEEGDVRDLVRAIQEFRKESGLTPNDKIAVEISASEETIMLIKKHEDQLKKVALLTSIEVESGAELSFTIVKR